MQEGQITDRFTKAIEQLGAIDANGKKKMEVRLGGIYALELIAHQSERDHWPIMEVLSAYVRENAPAPPESENTQGDQGAELLIDRPREVVPHIFADIQAILTVLRRRNHKYEQQGQYLDLSKSDLGRAYLSEADLSGAELSWADLWAARNLTQKQFETATGQNRVIRLPENLHEPDERKKG